MRVNSILLFSFLVVLILAMCLVSLFAFDYVDNNVYADVYYVRGNNYYNNINEGATYGGSGWTINSFSDGMYHISSSSGSNSFGIQLKHPFTISSTSHLYYIRVIVNYNSRSKSGSILPLKYYLSNSGSYSISNSSCVNFTNANLINSDGTFSSVSSYSVGNSYIFDSIISINSFTKYFAFGSSSSFVTFNNVSNLIDFGSIIVCDLTDMFGDNIPSIDVIRPYFFGQNYYNSFNISNSVVYNPDIYINSDSYDEGYQDGYDLGLQSGDNNLYNDGYQDGYQDGYDSSYQDGYDDGYLQGSSDTRFDDNYTLGFQDGYNSAFGDMEVNIIPSNAYRYIYSQTFNYKNVNYGVDGQYSQDYKLGKYTTTVSQSDGAIGAYFQFFSKLPSNTRISLKGYLLCGDTSPNRCYVGYIENNQFIELGFLQVRSSSWGESSVEIVAPVDLDYICFAYLGNTTTWISFADFSVQYTAVDVSSAVSNAYETGYRKAYENVLNDPNNEVYVKIRNTVWKDAESTYNKVGDFSFKSLISSMFDVPIGFVIGVLDKDPTSPTYNQRVGGLLNFYLPVFDIDLSQLFLSLITVSIIISIVKLFI